MKKIIFVLATLLQLVVSAQVNFSEHIAPIIFDHCTKCHREGEIGPMPLTTYEEVYAYAGNIEYVTSIRNMPPWMPDHNYSSFRDENWLSEEEINLISEWVENEMPQGDPELQPPAPVFPSGSQIGVPDLVLTMAEPYLHHGLNADQYQIFVIPTGMTEDKDIEAIEVRADNKSICHHAILGIDTTGTAATLDADDEEYGYTQFGGYGFDPADPFFGAWVPGANPLVYPPTIGKKIFAGADLLLQMHYGPSSIDQTDQTSVNIFFADDPIQRYVVTYPISPNDLDQPFVIPPNTVKTFHGKVEVPFSVSLIGVAPHGHLLCSSYEVYAVSPNEQDTIPMIHIPEWNFNWQGLYAYPNMKLIPQGYTVHCIGTFDNTANNPSNPNIPPEWVSWGESTYDEMYLCFLQFVPYHAGDENISLAAANEADMMVYPATQLFPSYPNPAREKVTIGFSLATPEKVELSLFDTQGKLVKKLVNNTMYPTGRHKVSVPVGDVSDGLYVVHLRAGATTQSQQLLITP
ncbi:MAG: T9SS type A sorting domain-containing protein [Crocinitomicaceae bacterium]|nr:T9SS type A sorting domain-containing protein [Crocinitomicaceae bacterium]